VQHHRDRRLRDADVIGGRRRAIGQQRGSVSRREALSSEGLQYETAGKIGRRRGSLFRSLFCREVPSPDACSMKLQASKQTDESASSKHTLRVIMESPKLNRCRSISSVKGLVSERFVPLPQGPKARATLVSERIAVQGRVEYTHTQSRDR